MSTDKYQLLEPFGGVVRMIMLSFERPDTKLGIRGHKIVSCSSKPISYYGITLPQAQGIDRFWNNDSKNDIYIFNHVICNFIELFVIPYETDDPEIYAGLINMCKYLCVGLKRLQKTYKIGNVVGTLQYYINVLIDIVNGTFHPDKLYKYPTNHQVNYFDAEINETDSVMYSTIFDIDKLKTFWKKAEIKSLCDQLDQCFMLYDEPEHIVFKDSNEDEKDSGSLVKVGASFLKKIINAAPSYMPYDNSNSRSNAVPKNQLNVNDERMCSPDVNSRHRMLEPNQNQMTNQMLNQMPNQNQALNQNQINNQNRRANISEQQINLLRSSLDNLEETRSNISEADQRDRNLLDDDVSQSRDDSSHLAQSGIETKRPILVEDDDDEEDIFSRFTTTVPMPTVESNSESKIAENAQDVIGLQGLKSLGSSPKDILNIMNSPIISRNDDQLHNQNPNPSQRFVKKQNRMSNPQFDNSDNVNIYGDADVNANINVNANANANANTNANANANRRNDAQNRNFNQNGQGVPRKLLAYPIPRNRKNILVDAHLVGIKRVLDNKEKQFTATLSQSVKGTIN